MREILRLENVCMTYQAENGEVEALRGVNLSAYEGEQIAIVGPSGCGKSTLLSIIAGLEREYTGRVLLGGQPVNGVSGKIGYMLQKDNLLSWRTVRQNVLLGLEIRKKLDRQTAEYADSLLETYGLKDFRSKYPSQLSGGMRQRVALIRTLAIKPELLLLDEAFSALDYQTRLSVTDDVHRILKRENKTAVIVTHDIPEGISMADSIVVLSRRPAGVRAVHKLDFGAPGGVTPPLERRNSPAFGTCFNLIWKELDVHG